MKSSRVALNWVVNRPGISSSLFAVESVVQLDEQIVALGLHLTPEELLEMDRYYTCTVINDHHLNRIPRTSRVR